MELHKEQELARQTVEVFRLRYSPEKDDHFPVFLAIKWNEALHTEPPDLKTMYEVCQTALKRRRDFGVGFFAFCNHMEQIVREEVRRTFEL
jgi:hypothetical protein